VRHCGYRPPTGVMGGGEMPRGRAAAAAAGRAAAA
jgi:hypothetical protein